MQQTRRPLKDNMHVVGCIGLDLTKPPPELKDQEVKAWLDDAQALGESVVYIATGTIAPLNQQQVMFA